MYFKPLDKAKINKILVISLTNIGDVILTLPVFDILKENFPQADISLMIGPKAKSLFEKSKEIKNLYIYDKRQPKKNTFELIRDLRKEKVDLVIDLRNSIFSLLIGAKYKTSFSDLKKSYWHMKMKHVKRLQTLFPDFKESKKKYAIDISLASKEVVGTLLDEKLKHQKYVVFIPGAADHKKRWSKENFLTLHKKIQEKYKVDVVYVGDDSDKKIVDEIKSVLGEGCINLAGKLNLIELAEVLKNSLLVVCNDSGPMHLASYLESNILAIFGPTNPIKYAPWSKNSLYLHNSNFEQWERIKHVTVEDVFNSFKIKEDVVTFLKKPAKNFFKNILIVRTDRIGDVVLTTPSLKAIKKHFPTAKITVLLSPLTESLLRDNPYVDNIIVDKRINNFIGRLDVFKLAYILRKQRFDLSIIYHTKKRFNIACAVAGIKTRIGYKNKKFGNLLTDGVYDHRHLGEKHESQYCLDVLKTIGVNEKDLSLSLSIDEDANQWVENCLNFQNITQDQDLVAFHLGASDPAKRWSEYHFACLANEISKKYNVKIVLVGTSAIKVNVDRFLSKVKVSCVDLTGQTDVMQFVAFLKKCKMLISNDSGPVHIAAALKVPVVSIFTRNQPGINPERWGPLGSMSVCVAIDRENPLQNDLSFLQSGEIDSKYLEIIPVSQVLEEVDGLFKLC
jgi:lipopolysaccharide heptosyltransferase II